MRRGLQHRPGGWLVQRWEGPTQPLRILGDGERVMSTAVMVGRKKSERRRKRDGRRKRRCIVWWDG